MKQRESNFELLRIIAIIMVISIHTVASMILVAFPEKLTWKYCAVIYSISHTAVPIFIMLTGFFSYKSKSNLKPRIKKLVIPYLTYFFIFLIYLLIYLPENLSIRSLLSIQFFSLTTGKSPNYFGQMWYFYLLFAVILLSRFINILIDNLDRKMHKKLIIILISFFFAIPTMNAVFDIQVLFAFAMSDLKLLLLVFITYYIIGAYFNKYDIKIKKAVSMSIFIWGTVLVYMLSYIWSVYHPGAELMYMIGGENVISSEKIIQLHEGGGFTKSFMNYDSIFILFSSSGLLLFFKELKVRRSKIINYLASLTFGVYINHIFVRDFLIKYLPSIDGVYGNAYMQNSALLILLTVIISFAFETLRKLILFYIITIKHKIKSVS